MTANASAGPITDASYWDQSWQTATTPFIPAWHGISGRHGAFLKLLRRHAGRAAIDGARVVELGGATSVRLLTLARFAGCDATALDYAPAGLAATRRLFAVHGIERGCTCVLGDMFAFQPAQPFDLVTHWGLIEHFQRPEDVMALCARLVRPGGVVAFGMPNMRALGAYLWRTRSPENWSRHIYHSDETVARACAAAGLELTSVFHWNVPMLKTEWESPERWLQALGYAQVGMYGLAKILPIFSRGASWLSQERGFIAIKR